MPSFGELLTITKYDSRRRFETEISTTPLFVNLLLVLPNLPVLPGASPDHSLIIRFLNKFILIEFLKK